MMRVRCMRACAGCYVNPVMCVCTCCMCVYVEYMANASAIVDRFKQFLRIPTISSEGNAGNNMDMCTAYACDVKAATHAHVCAGHATEMRSGCDA